MNLQNDIYYLKDYISLYLHNSDKIFEFEYKEGNNIFINKSIKRIINKIGDISIDKYFYDLETAYGYGGFWTNSSDINFISRAMRNYEKRCQDENIIAEFIRFHPFNSFPKNYDNFFDFNIYDRDVVYVDLNTNILPSYSSKVRNIIKRANEKFIIQKSDNIDKFIEIYQYTMKKNNADEFYFFNKEYFEKLLKLSTVKLYEVIFENKIIAMGFFMFGEDIAHYHLSANTPLSYKLNANYALLHNLFLIAQQNGIKYFLLGGGTTSFIDDSLLKFKKKFSKKTKPFYISGKIYNQKIYDNYIKIWEKQSKEDVKYFLKYRLEIK